MKPWKPFLFGLLCAFILGILVNVVLPVEVGAQADITDSFQKIATHPDVDLDKGSGQTEKPIIIIIAGATRTIITLTGVVFLIMMISAGIMWLSSAGSATQITKAKGIIKTSLIGIIVVSLAYALVTLVISLASGQTGGGGGGCSTVVGSACQIPADCCNPLVCVVDKCETL